MTSPTDHPVRIGVQLQPRTAGSRLDDLAAALPRTKSRLAKLNPAPTRDIPILIGGAGEKKTLRLVAEHASIWHSFATRDTYPAKSAVLADHCKLVGRDPASIQRSASVAGETRAWGDGVDGLIAAAEALTRLGVNLLAVASSGPDYNLTAAEALCRWRDRRSPTTMQRA
jgi:alkanesulfonate monooxygenase SsuD/methylene tetrahydromethanopterin reductase-like flavin-dependent oxidoreductase (luciferase family)